MNSQSKAEKTFRKLTDVQELVGAGYTVADACKKVGTSKATYYRLAEKFEGCSQNQIEARLQLEESAKSLHREVAMLRRKLEISSRAFSMVELDRQDRRRIVNRLVSDCNASERLVCRTIRYARSTHRYQAKLPKYDNEVLDEIVVTSSEFPRLGYRRIAHVLQQRGISVSKSQVYEVRHRKNLRAIQSPNPRLEKWRNKAIRAQSKNHIWACDFFRIRDGFEKQGVVFSVLDEFTRECVALNVCKIDRLTDDWVTGVLMNIVDRHGAPRYLRNDNEPIWNTDGVRLFRKRHSISSLFCDPGSPWQNAFVESFHSRLKDEFFSGVNMLRDWKGNGSASLAAWREYYNHLRPHSSLENLPPSTFAARQSDLDANPRVTLDD